MRCRLSQFSPRFLQAVGALALSGIALAPAGAQPCARQVSRTTLAALTGRPIRSVDVVTEQVDMGTGTLGAFATSLHVRTRPSTVRRQLLFAVGDTVDTLRVAESLRRLRQRRYLSDVDIEATSCTGTTAVDLVVRTRDAWSTRAELSMKSSSGGGTAGTTNQSTGTSSTIGLEERNLFGSGRGAKIYVRSFGSRLGAGVQLDDPWFLGTSYSAQIGSDSYRDGADMRLRLAKREESIFDVWGSSLTVARGIRKVPGADTLHRDALSLLVTRRLGGGDNAGHVTAVIFGVEGEQTRLVAAPGTALVGPAFAARRLAAIDVGMRRRTALYDTLTWLLPGAAIVDVPLGGEGEVVAGGGWDLAAGAPALHVDAWSGRAWLPHNGSLLTADSWASGYMIGGAWRAGSVRGALTYRRSAPRGHWTTRLSAERLFAPDPDTHALIADDPTTSILTDRLRLSQTAVAAGVERSLRLRSITRSWALDGAAFAAASLREDAAGYSPEILTLGVVGLGLRATPRRAGRGTFRLDVGYPIAGSAIVPKRLYVGLSVSPSFDQSRHRGGVDY